MSYSLTIRSEAEADLADAKTWYEQRRKGLSEDFLLCIEESLAKIRRNPEMFEVLYKDVRRAVVRRFPYGVFFRMLGKQVIVLGVFHARRDPRHWKSRA